jgi:serine/threonine-protein kinase
MSEYKYCVSCGTKIDAAAKFCVVCGERVIPESRTSELDETNIIPPTQQLFAAPESASVFDVTPILPLGKSDTRSQFPIISDPAYRIESELGSGGGGVVYKAWHTRLQKHVVLKRIKDESGLMQIDRRRGEADILKNLKHANLPQLYDFIEDEGGVYTVMEFIPGRSFAELLGAGKRRYPQAQIVGWARQLADALRYLHGQDPPVLHSDIKPGNIMLTPSGDVCLIDFNVSLVLTGESAQALGLSHGYASPEQYGPPISAAGRGGTSTRRRVARADARSDVYSFGATLYHMLTGERPTAATEDIKPLREYGLPLSEALVDIVEHCMERDPNERFQTAAELYDAISNIRRLDRRYKAHKLKTAVTAAVLAALFASFGTTAALGWRRLGEEKDENYNLLVRNIARDGGDGAYIDAIALFPERPAAYREQAVKLCVPGGYEDCIEYVGDVMAILSAHEIVGDELYIIGDIYYLQANAYFELEDYPNALISYEAAADANPDSPELYRDWAIALARCGYIERAEEMLIDIEDEDMDLGIDSVDLLRGEIAYAKGENRAAIALFDSVIRTADSDYIKNRAYIICDKAYRREPELVDDNVALLRAAIADSSNSYVLILKERLADALVRAGKYAEAAALFEELREAGNLSYQTRLNIGALYQKLGDYAGARAIYKELAADSPDDYRPYMLLAYLELEEQAARVNESREYANAAEHYSEARKRYDERGQSAADDLEMSMLGGLIDDLRQNGWIS